MKIGVDVRTLMDKYYSGVSSYCYNLLKEIIKIDDKNEYILYYNSAKAVELPKFSKDVEVVNTKYPNKIFNYLLQKQFSWPKIDKVIGGVDVFFSPHYNFLSLSSNTKKVLTIHDLSYLRYSEFFSRRKNIWHQAINIKKLAQEMDKIVAVSENTKNDVIELLEIPEEKIEVIYSGLEESFCLNNNVNTKKDLKQNFKEIKAKYSLPDKYILSLSTIEPRKNLKNLILAYEKLRDSREDLADISLVIVGFKGWKYQGVLELIKKSKYQKDIHLTSYIDNIDKPFIYQKAEVFVYPSFYEGFGFPLLEAMASKTPIICSFSSSLPEVIGGAGIMIDPGSSDEITRAMTEILDDKDLRDYYINLGLKQVKKFSWRSSAEKYLQLFNDLKENKN